jgi:hypothetical protein
MLAAALHVGIPRALSNECFARLSPARSMQSIGPSEGLGSVDATGYFRGLELQVPQVVWRRPTPLGPCCRDLKVWQEQPNVSAFNGTAQ